MCAAYESATGKNIRDATVLDYGAGWGRITRLMLQVVPEDRVFAADVAYGADVFDGLGFSRPCDRIDPVPVGLPYPKGRFDLIWMFSVLTHLPADAADAVMSAVREVLSPTGLLAVTVRPIEFWEVTGDTHLAEQHRLDGFAHRASGPNWGDTSMSRLYVTKRWPAWRLFGTAWHAIDPLQDILFLQPS
jgi:SAM-dependent methyltransferase